MGYDGWVIVGTKLDNKQLEKDLKNAEKRLQQYEKEAESLTKTKAKADIDLQSYEEQKRLIQEMTDEMNQYAQSEQEVTNNLNNEKIQLEQLNEKYNKQLNNVEKINKKIQENAKNQSLLNTQIGELNAKLGNVKGYNSIKNSIDTIGKSMNNTLKKVVRWGLAVFSVRSAYMAIRSAMSTLSQYNQELADKLNTIKLVFASGLEPVVMRLVDLVYNLLVYINEIAKAWFNVDMFASASEKSMKNSANSAEKMKKSLAGFDEMNVATDTTSAGGTTGFVAPEDVPIPSWMQWIIDNQELVVGALAGIAGGLLAVNLGLGAIKGFGIGAVLGGIVMLLEDIKDFIADPSWEEFVSILGDIAIIIGGIMLLMGNWWGLLVVFIGGLVKLVAENWDKIWAIIEPIATLVYEKILLPILDFVVVVFNTIVSVIKTTIGIIGGIFSAVVYLITNPFKIASETIYGVFKGIMTFFQGFGEVIRGIFECDITSVLKGFQKMFKGIMDSLWTIAKAPLNLIIGGINSLIKGMNKISFDVPDWIPGIGGKKWGFNIPTIPKLAVGGIVNMPSRGVPVGSAITGEAGAEGVIPLTDSQAMETLGQAIGKYININATIPIYMGNRQIAREIKKINTESNFATNS